MSNINLNALLDSIESDYGMEKSASATSSVVANGQVKVSDELKTVLEKRASLEVSKSAFEDGEKVARELLEKLAGDLNLAIAENAVSVADDDAKVTPTVDGTAEGVLQGTVAKQVANGATGEDRVDPILDKQAQVKEENFNMANRILEKLAEAVGAEDVGQVSGISAPNLAQANTLAQVSFDDAKVDGTPGVEGNVNAVLQNIVAKFQAKGAGSENLADGQIAAEGAQVTQGIQGGNEEIEKAAAVAYLTEAGVDFDSAVSMVKEAQFNMEKEAAFEALTEAGFDFDTAVEMVKEAAALTPDEIIDAKRGTNMVHVPRANRGGVNPSFMDRLSRLARNPVARGVAAAGAVGAAAYGAKKAFSGQEKKAALDELIEAGVDYDQAVDMIKEAEEAETKKKSNHLLASTAVSTLLPAGGLYSPAIQDKLIAMDHDKEMAPGAISRNLAGVGRSIGYGLLGAAGAGLAGGALGGALKKSQGAAKLGGTLGAGLGGLAGDIYGKKVHGESLNKLYAEKKAAMDELLEAGVDFDTAVDLIKQAEAELTQG